MVHECLGSESRPIVLHDHDLGVNRLRDEDRGGMAEGQNIHFAQPFL